MDNGPSSEESRPISKKAKKKKKPPAFSLLADDAELGKSSRAAYHRLATQ